MAVAGMARQVLGACPRGPTSLLGVRMIRIKRAYVPADPSDGFRVLVDRLWPRGLKKSRAALDLWAQALAPSPSLRTWFGHDPERFQAFAVRYRRELRRAEARTALETLARQAARGRVTLVYGARDEVHNGAVVLRRALQGMAGERPARRAESRHSSARARPALHSDGP